MEFKVFKNKIELLIQADKIKEAANACLLQAVECYEPSLKHYMVQVQRTITEKNNQRASGLITSEEYDKARETISEDIIEFLDELDKFLFNHEIGVTTETAVNLKNILNSIRGNQLIFSQQNLFVDDLKAVITEIKKSYQIVLKQIEKYNQGLLSNPVDFNIYNEFAVGSLLHEMDEGRGHCSIMFDHYNNHIKPILEANQLGMEDEFDNAERAFGKLGDADHTIFIQLMRVGNFIIDHSDKIIEAKINQGDTEARQLILQGRKKLKNLQLELNEGLQEIIELEIQLGL